VAKRKTASGGFADVFQEDEPVLVSATSILPGRAPIGGLTLDAGAGRVTWSGWRRKTKPATLYAEAASGIGDVMLAANRWISRSETLVLIKTSFAYRQAHRREGAQPIARRRGKALLGALVAALVMWRAAITPESNKSHPGFPANAVVSSMAFLIIAFPS
jgi:hypothetical protein